MGQFFKFVFASCLGVILATIVTGIISFGILGAVAGSMESKGKKIEPNSVLHLKFDQPIPEKTNNLPLDPFSLQEQKILGTHEILDALQRARKDDHIKGVFLETDGLQGGLATADLIRDALAEFQKEGKFVYAHSNAYTQGSYYLASAADKIYLSPVGLLDFRGFAAQVPFFKDMLDKAGVHMQVYYAGKFKSATEPFRRNNMSEENKLQVREYLNDAFEEFLSDISEGRNIPVSELRRIADGYLAFMPEQALQLKMVDELAHREAALEGIRKKLGLGKKEKIKTISIEDYNLSNPAKSNLKASNKIAVVYAEGNIVDGKGEPGSIGGAKYVDIISKIRKDDKVKAIVLRINSGGGSAMASEDILRELELAQEQGIKVVVSMGDYAASGGYYIACKADSIFAEPNTLTGSIGVFSMIPSAQKLLNDKIGITFDTVKTGPFAHGISPFYDMSEQEGKIMQAFVDNLYTTFIGHVSKGRNLSPEAVNEIAQGRVWTGKKALGIGLVDRLADLDEAILSAAALADLKDYRITEYPRIKEPIQQFIDELTGTTETRTQRALRSQLGSMYPHYRFVKELQDSKGAQARLPFIIPFR
ncbi:MAG TPA: signal peptide peptidase SppA [Saprospiraceae bacterium]|nr:signal peptide peptidase SppA [Saprospiraceae bacterium]